MAVPGHDATLLRAVSAGDEAALKALYGRHVTWLYVRLMRRCNDEDVVADVLQDTFLAVWRGARDWRGDGEVAAWIWLPLFPYGPEGAWAASRLLWLGFATVAAIVVAASCQEGPARRTTP